MSLDERPRLLAVTNVPCETPHRTLDSCAALGVRHVRPLEGDAMPAHEEVAGALVMGGPMNVDETDRHPGAGDDARVAGRGGAPRDACTGDLPRRAAPGAVARCRGRPGERKEIGFREVTVDDPADPILGGLAPGARVLRWHGDVFELPSGRHSGPKPPLGRPPRLAT
jgi:GMP synthase (glutamine-hydrolysing)